MCGWPVNALTAPAEGKLILGGEDIGRHFFLNGSFGHGIERGIAFYTAREGILQRIQATIMDDLFELLTKMVALDQEDRRRTFLVDPTVPRENQPTLPPCRADQLITR